MAAPQVPNHPQLKYVYDQLTSIGPVTGLAALLIPGWGQAVIKACWMLVKYHTAQTEGKVLNTPDDVTTDL